MKKDLLKLVVIMLVIYIPVGIVGAISETGNITALIISIVCLIIYVLLMATIGMDWIADKLDL